MKRLAFLTCATLAHALPSSSSLLDIPTGQQRDTVQSILGQIDVLEGNNDPTTSSRSSTMKEMLRALEVMQDTYFDIFTGTWPDSIDWTAAVLGTHVSASLSSIVSSISPASLQSCSGLLQWQNTIDKYYAHTSVFYFGENAFGLRNQAFDDMLWVVLGWLENIKFAEMFALKHWDVVAASDAQTSGAGWHGLQFSPMAAHRSRIFYDLAAQGWDDSLCDGGMVWNSHLTPYKNAITNELFTTASIAMYLYFPGDNNSSPYLTPSSGHWRGFGKPHDSTHLENAIQGYKWLTESGMQSSESGLYRDGFHILGWRRYPNGTINPGTGRCDELDRMVYSYNQGVILSASRGLWMATGARSYLDDGHSLIENVMRATGWPNRGKAWHGLGRGGVLEEYCDTRGSCSQDGQTFKGIFFLHLSEFCRPLWPHEEDFMSTQAAAGFDRAMYQYHLARCAAYGKWIAHNAEAALATRNEDGLFGMWWTFRDPDDDEMMEILESTTLPPGAEDHKNPDIIEHPLLRRGDFNDRGRGRTVETQAGGLSVLRAHWNWETNFP
jgi:Glycosyl hydrolase family 76